MERLIGRALRGIRAGDRHLAWNMPALADAPDTIAISSSAFAAGAPIPARHAGIGAGDNISPPLAWSGVPRQAAELVLFIEDPDAPLPRPVVHVLATGIAPLWQGLPEGALSLPGDPGLRLGRGSFGRRGYAGPRPVRGHGPHRYIFQIVAIDRPLVLDAAPDRVAVLAMIAGHVLARGRLVGTYERP